MRAEQVREALQARPFEPIRVFISDGGTYDIHHPDLCLVGVHHLVIGIAKRPRPQPAADYFATVALTHVTRIEPLNGAAPEGPASELPTSPPT